MLEHTTQTYDTLEKEIILRLLKAKEPKEIITSLSVEMFNTFEFKKIFSVCKRLFETTGIIDSLTLVSELSSDKIEDILSESEYTTTANTKYYINKLHNIYFDRLISEAKTTEQMKLVQEEINKWQDITVMEHISKDADKMLLNYYDKWETAIKTKFNNLDAVLGSLQGGDFLIFAGATSSGKTMTALNILLNMAKAGIKCNFYSLEMSKEQLVNRIISHETHINGNKYRSFTLTEEEQKKHLQYTTDILPTLPINICTDFRNITVDKIESIERKSDSQIVFIDYLGLLKAKNNSNQYERITEISTDLKRVAMAVNKPFFVLHQLSRDLFNRQDKRPVLSDLRGSGQLEQDADFVLFVHRPAYFDLDADKTDLQIIVAKNRHGSTGNILEFSYLAENQTIVERKRFF